ncbi:hypothetical protein HOH87_00690 [bacterium]|jgi:hypothetical protein|nr:hypothetical protein [bacterium]
MAGVGMSKTGSNVTAQHAAGQQSAQMNPMVAVNAVKGPLQSGSEVKSTSKPTMVMDASLRHQPFSPTAVQQLGTTVTQALDLTVSNPIAKQSQVTRLDVNQKVQETQPNSHSGHKPVTADQRVTESIQAVFGVSPSGYSNYRIRAVSSGIDSAAGLLFTNDPLRNAAGSKGSAVSSSSSEHRSTATFQKESIFQFQQAFARSTVV